MIIVHATYFFLQFENALFSIFSLLILRLCNQTYFPGRNNWYFKTFWNTFTCLHKSKKCLQIDAEKFSEVILYL